MLGREQGFVMATCTKLAIELRLAITRTEMCSWANLIGRISTYRPQEQALFVK